ncbi:MAG: transcriptional regulator [Salinibacterium sp.]|nr:transcriptional regulator [Salinibacterium sp.]
MVPPSRNDDIAAIAALNDPLGRRLYDVVASHGEPIGTDAAAVAAGIPRSTTAFHLEKLVSAGLVSTGFRRQGRGGPGSGRPARMFSLSTRETSVAVPDRHYDLAGDLLASAIERLGQTGEVVRDCLASVAVTRGRELAAERPPLDVLSELGYEPITRDTDVVLANCPFHRLAQDHTALICDANVALVTGIVGDSHTAHFNPQQGQCCVTLSTSQPTLADQ